MSCIIELPAQKKTDTWDGLSEVSLSSDGTELASPLASVKMAFTASGNGAATLIITSVSGDITITDAANWEFIVEPRTPIGLDVGFYSWEIETTDTEGTRKTYQQGIIEITNDSI